LEWTVLLASTILIVEVETKSTPTIESIWTEFAARLGQFIQARVSDPPAAEDILQDVFVKFQRQFHTFRDVQKIRGWLLLVARNAVIDHYRKRKTTTELPDSLPAEAQENVTEMNELKMAFHRIIDSLPEPYREALVLTEFEGMSQKELAKRLGISLSGAKSRVQRAREQLKGMLLDYCHREFGHAIGWQACPKGRLPILQAPQESRTEVKKTRKELDALTQSLLDGRKCNLRPSRPEAGTRAHGHTSKPSS